MTPTVEVEITEVGRRDVGRSEGGGPVPGTEVLIAGEPFMRFANGYYEPCRRCDPQWSGGIRSFGHVMAGVCFQCAGVGLGRHYDTAEEVVKVAERRRKSRERAAAKRADRERARLAALAEFRIEHDALLTRAEPFAEPLDRNAPAAQGWEPSEPPAVTALVSKARYAPLTVEEVAELTEALPAAEAHAAAKAEEVAARRYVGNVGEKLFVTGIVKACIPVERTYGFSVSHSYVFIVAGVGEHLGVTVKWFASRWPGADRGDKVTIVGTITGHAEYDGVPQTSVTRAKVTVHD